jgi:predicted lipid carrier protein YhbT
LFFVTRVAKAVNTGEIDFVGAVPEQAFLTVLKIEIDVDLAVLEGQRRYLVLIHRSDDRDTVFDSRLLLRRGCCVRSDRRRLVLSCAPG